MEFLQRNWLKASPYLALLVLEICFEVTESVRQSGGANHLANGKEYVDTKQYAEALRELHLAIGENPNDYEPYFYRSIAYLALKKIKNALNDLDQALELNPHFYIAKVWRGEVHLKLANYDLAQLDFYNVLQVDPTNERANFHIQQIAPAKENKNLAEYYYNHGDYVNAIHLISEVIATSPWSADLLELRGDMHLKNSDAFSAIADITASTQFKSDHTQGFFTIATILYELGRATEALKSIRECLKLDQDHKDCLPFYKKIKKVEKALSAAKQHSEEKNYAQCISSAKDVLKHEKEIDMIIYEAKHLLCMCYTEEEQASEAIAACSDALAISKDPGVYCDRAEAYIISELYDDAIRDYRAALEIDQHFQRAQEGIEKAKKLQQRAERRDYYKILGVKRTASKREIIKAYRKKAQEWHPDNYQTDEKMKKVAEKKFIDIAAAKEVLTDEEKRRQFDNGEDPLDPESGKSSMPNFQHFHSFHGSPFQFRFHFN